MTRRLTSRSQAVGDGIRVPSTVRREIRYVMDEKMVANDGLC